MLNYTMSTVEHILQHNTLYTTWLTRLQVLCTWDMKYERFLCPPHQPAGLFAELKHKKGGTLRLLYSDVFMEFKRTTLWDDFFIRAVSISRSGAAWLSRNQSQFHHWVSVRQQWCNSGWDGESIQRTIGSSFIQPLGKHTLALIISKYTRSKRYWRVVP